MRRTDRLFDLIQILRDGRLHTAREMAERLEVSTRTLWRDMASLIASGLPVEGERGVGYILREPITLPPLTLTDSEAEALRLGLALVARGADPSLAKAAHSLSGKIAAVIPTPLAARLGEDDLYVHPSPQALAAAPHLPLLRRAMRETERLRLIYPDAQGTPVERMIWPLGLEFWGKVWTLAAWCETRAAFRTFRVDRFLRIESTGTPFTPEHGQRLRDYHAALQATALAADQADAP